MELNKKDLIKKWKARPYSWSQHSQFRDYSHEEWYQSYVLGIKKPSNKRMDFGSLVGKRIESDPTYIPQLPRDGKMEYGIEVKLGKIDLIGYMDSYDDDLHIINEYKTSSLSGWDQDKVEKHDQLTFYCLLIYLRDTVAPEFIDINLHHLVTEEGGDFSIKFASPFTLNSYKTKRDTRRVLMFGAEIIKQRKEMEKYIKDHD